MPPKLIPQMIDASEIVAHALTIPGLTVAVLAPNLKGARRTRDRSVRRSRGAESRRAATFMDKTSKGGNVRSGETPVAETGRVRP